MGHPLALTLFSLGGYIAMAIFVTRAPHRRAERWRIADRPRRFSL